MEPAIISVSRHDVYPFISPSDALKDAASGKTVLITGAGTGIGKRIAEFFALAGASTVIIVGRRKEKLAECAGDIERIAPGCKVLQMVADVSSEENVDDLFKDLNDQRTAVDVLINNAGMNAQRGPIVQSSVDLWWKTYEVNLKGPFICSRAYLRALAGSPGTIINVSSLGSYAMSPGSSSYGSSKAALNRLTEYIHAEHADQGIHCVAFHPGGIPETGITSTQSEQFRRRWLVDTAELSAGTCLYLTTKRAAFLNGRYVDATWDMEELEGLKSEIISEDMLKMGLVGARRPRG